MVTPMDRVAFAAHVIRCLSGRCVDSTPGSSRGLDGMRMILLLAGAAVETVLVFDEPDLALMRFYDDLEALLRRAPVHGPVFAQALPEPTMIDRETEQGRAIARRLFEDWTDAPQDFVGVLADVTHHMIIAMEAEGGGQERSEVFRLLIECANRAMAYEVAAQELCDVVVERKIADEGWSLAESISGLSAVAGRSLALAFSCEAPGRFKAHDLPGYFERVAHVMTQEAVRHGTPAGTSWRFGLAANDQPTSAPYELIAGLEPACRDFFRVIRLNSLSDQAVACAKAAGRMLAMASGGERPEIEPVIAKPLAMAAMSDTYKTVYRELS